MHDCTQLFSSSSVFSCVVCIFVQMHGFGGCVCVPVWCVCMCVCVLVQVCTCGGQELMLGIILNHSSIVLFGAGPLNQTQSLSTWLVLLVNLLQGPLALPFCIWNADVAFVWVSGECPMLTLVCKHLNHRAIPLNPCLAFMHGF